MHFDLDHIAVAAETTDSLWPRYAGDLAGAYQTFGENPGFRSGQVKFANGMKVEVLEPYHPKNNDFLRRFLDANGPGPHHMTFKVTPSIEEAIARATALGFPVVGINIGSPEWKEAFIHPKGAHGIVVQMAWVGGDDEWGVGKPDPFPTPLLETPATFPTIAHLVADLNGALKLFHTLLNGQIVGERQGFLPWDAHARVVELAWPGPGRITLIEPSTATNELGAWLGNRSGRIHHLSFTHPEPASARDAIGIAAGVYEIKPAKNFGVRLILRNN